MGTYSGSYGNGIKLTNPTQNPVTITASGFVYGGVAIYGNLLAAWTIENFGTISQGGAGHGIRLVGAGEITNYNVIKGSDGVMLGAGGSVTNARGGDIAESLTGIDISGGAGTVTNYGTIHAGVAVALSSGGTVFNGQYASIQTTNPNTGGILIYGGEASVTNFGTIDAAGFAVLSQGGAGQVTISNGSNDFVYASITSGIRLREGGTVVNYGTIVSSRSGDPTVQIYGINGAVTNGSAYATGAYIGSTGATAINSDAGTVVNYGRIQGFHDGVDIGANGGGVINQSSGIIAAAGNFGVRIDTGTVINYGTITGETGVMIGFVGPTTGDKIVNYGSILGAGGIAVILQQGVLVDEPSSYFLGTVQGSNGATLELAAGGGAGSISGIEVKYTNFGTVKIDPDAYWIISGSNTILSGSSFADSGAVNLVGTLSNSGRLAIQGSLLDSGTFNNSGNVNGSLGLSDGAALSNGAHAIITAAAGATAVYAGSGDTVTNGGTIIGQNGTALAFSGGHDLLILEPGGSFVGVITGDHSALELASSASTGIVSGLGTNFVGFKTVTVDTGAHWQVSGTAKGESFINDGTVIAEGALVFSALDEDSGKHGLVDIGGHAVVEFAGAVATGQTIAFTDTTGSLVLDKVKSFAATISGFRGGDIIDLAHVKAKAVSFSDGVLSLTEGGKTIASLTLTGTYTASEFRLSADGHGGTDITLGAPAGEAALWVIRS